MSETQRGRVVIWGVVTQQGDTYAAGLVVSQTHGKAGATAFGKDKIGETVTEIFYDEQDVCDIEVDCETGTTLPDRGDDITIDGVACIVQEASLKWENEKIKRLSIKAKKFAALIEA